ncbi:MAG: alpha/beta hydrolase [Acidobacteriia bacterium]|nr:alpha/beta hydrolase [Terriglobia bacterium]
MSPSEFFEKSFDAQGVKINFAEGPHHGPPLLMLHGVIMRWQSMRPLMPGLADRWHVYAPDFRGHGGSARTPGNYDLSDFVADTQQFLEREIGEPAYIFGHSMGGIIALILAAHCPTLVKAVVVGDSPLFPENYQKSSLPKVFAQIRDIAAKHLPLQETITAIGDMRVHWLGHETPLRFRHLLGRNGAYLRFFSECVTYLDPEVLTALLDHKTVEPFHAETILPQITCPVFFIQAGALMSRLLTAKDLHRALSMLPQARSVTFPFLGHPLHLQRPEPVLRALKNYLESVR